MGGSILLSKISPAETLKNTLLPSWGSQSTLALLNAFLHKVALDYILSFFPSFVDTFIIYVLKKERCFSCQKI